MIDLYRFYLKVEFSLISVEKYGIIMIMNIIFIISQQGGELNEYCCCRWPLSDA